MILGFWSCFHVMVHRISKCKLLWAVPQLTPCLVDAKCVSYRNVLYLQGKRVSIQRCEYIGIWNKVCKW